MYLCYNKCKLCLQILPYFIIAGSDPQSVILFAGSVSMLIADQVRNDSSTYKFAIEFNQRVQ